MKACGLGAFLATKMPNFRKLQILLLRMKVTPKMFPCGKWEHLTIYQDILYSTKRQLGVCSIDPIPSIPE